MIDIYELKLTSSLHVLFSFPLSPQSTEFSFSPASFHASFINKTEVTILDVQDSRLPLQATVHHGGVLLPGQFYSDGCFFISGPVRVGSSHQLLSSPYGPGSQSRGLRRSHRDTKEHCECIECRGHPREKGLNLVDIKASEYMS